MFDTECGQVLQKYFWVTFHIFNSSIAKETNKIQSSARHCHLKNVTVS